ncbi:MAG: diguanylate cyclase, partial [Rhodospirillaceae bacterium]
TAVAALEIPHSSSSTAPHVTLSLGAATAVPDMQKSPDILLKAADEQLYRAKTQGRNRTQGIAAEL